ncbi:Aste57867_8055 [Aphanomyces stellatus]|uniref:Aste57867_8055 protein n=1 Tax=Aphanomyces stellatus TaxID=120398 RepID=A0A485KJA5_9STRA|nr:hypothetical protein As57867_008025 [Aphanomyces stellatus]VFT84947.1 Aste57867_8055 [Aphanomyces stellatus]
MSLLEVLHGILNLTTICDLLLDWAASRNHLDIIIYLHGLGHIGCTKDAMDWACEHGNIEMVMFLHAHGYNTCTSDGLDKALAFGYMDIVAYVRENNLAQHGDGFLDLIDIVAGNGLMAAVAYLEDLGALVSPKAMDVAAAKGNMATVQWLHEKYDAGCTYYALQDASMNGHIDIVKFVIDTYPYVCVPPYRHLYSRPIQGAMKLAATYGHLDIVKLLHNHKLDDEFSDDPVDGAAGNGHFHVVNWFYENRHERCTPRAVDLAARNNHFEMVTWLHERRHLVGSTDAGDSAASNGNLEMLQWLFRHSKSMFSNRIVYFAASYGHLDILKWLHANQIQGCTQDAMNGAAANGHLDVIKWLYQHRMTGCKPRALKSAAENGHVAVVKWLLANRMDGCPRCARVATEESQHSATESILKAVPRGQRDCNMCRQLCDQDYLAGKGICFCRLNKDLLFATAIVLAHDDDDDI